MAAVLLRRLFSSDFQDFYTAVSTTERHYYFTQLIGSLFTATTRVSSSVETANSFSSSTAHQSHFATKSMRSSS